MVGNGKARGERNTGWGGRKKKIRQSERLVEMNEGWWQETEWLHSCFMFQ